MNRLRTLASLLNMVISKSSVCIYGFWGCLRPYCTPAAPANQLKGCVPFNQRINLRLTQFEGRHVPRLGRDTAKEIVFFPERAELYSVGKL